MSQIPYGPPTQPESEPPQPVPHTLAYGVVHVNPKRTATTVLGIIAIVLGALGSLASGFNMVVVLAGAKTMIPGLENISKGLLLTDATFQLICKIGLLSIGILMLCRSSLARRVAVLTLITSIISSGIAIMVVQKLTLFNPTEAKEALFGAIAIIVMALALYLSLIIYMMTRATREEFEAVNKSHGSSITKYKYDHNPPPME